MIGWVEPPWVTRSRARWGCSRVEPFRVRVWLASPVAWDGRDAITIDGAIQFAVVLDATGRLPDDVFAEIPAGTPKIDIPIPVADSVIGGWPIAHASWGWPARCAVESKRWRRKRARAEHYAIERLGISGGWGKSLNIPVATLTTPYLDFALLGDRGKVATLLDFIGGLGRDHNRGLGTVLGYEFTRLDADRSLVWKGAPQRSLPLVRDGGISDPAMLAPGSWCERVDGTRAPYWHQATRTRCVVPVVRIGAEA